MGLLRNLYERGKVGVKKICTSIAASFNTAVADVAEALGCDKYAQERRDVAEDWRRSHEKWGRELDGLRNEAKLGVSDKKLVEKSTEVKNYFEVRYATRKASDTLRDMTAVDRQKEVATVMEDVAGILGIKEKPTIKFFQPTETQTYMGAYRKSDNTLFMNAALIDCNDPRLYVEQISTGVHEMMHALQWQAMLADDNDGYSQELVDSWRYNAIPGHYIKPDDNPWLYTHQALEVPAFGIEKVINNSLK